MKTFVLTAGLVGFLAIGGVSTTAMAQPYGYGGAAVSVGVFYDTLSPYGEWVSVNGYGRVWRPYPEVVGVDFRPYATGGHWVYTDYGWSFESDFDWGWAPFHYGRWWEDPMYGWVWMPDTVWAPAWVDWRFGGGYVGWAPLPPAGIVVTERYHPWCFVETRYFVDPYFYRYTLPPERFHVAFASTWAVHNEVTYGGARWYSGPPVQHVATAVGQPIQPVRVAPPRPGYVQPVRVPPPAYAAGVRPPGGVGTSAGHIAGPAPAYQGVPRPPAGNGAWQAPGHTFGAASAPQPPARYNAPPPVTGPSYGFGGRPPMVAARRPEPYGAPAWHGGGGGFAPPGVGGGFRPAPARPLGAPVARPPSRRH